MLTPISHLCSQIVLENYFQRYNILLARNSNGPSIWNAIVKTFKALEDGFHFKFWNGTTRVLYESWFIKDPLLHHVSFVHIQDTDLQVKDINTILRKVDCKMFRPCYRMRSKT